MYIGKQIILEKNWEDQERTRLYINASHYELRFIPPTDLLQGLCRISYAQQFLAAAYMATASVLQMFSSELIPSTPVTRSLYEAFTHDV